MRRIRALTEDTEFLAVTVSKMAIGSGAAKNSVSRLLESATPSDADDQSIQTYQ